MTFNEIKQKIESNGCFKVIETPIEIITSCGESSVTYNKTNGTYTAKGFGSPLMFTTHPIYDDWRQMIEAWIEEIDQ